MDITDIISRISLSHKELTGSSLGEDAIRYYKTMLLEYGVLTEKDNLIQSITKEEKEQAEKLLCRQIQQDFDVPVFSTVREISKLTGLSPQVVRLNCKNNTYKGYQSFGESGIWKIETKQFLSHVNWHSFMRWRKQQFENTIEASLLAQQIWNELDVGEGGTEG